MELKYVNSNLSFAIIFLFTLLLFNHSQLCAQCARYLVQHVDIHGVLAGFNAADVSGGDARNLSELLLLPALGGAHRTDALAHGLTLIINYLVFFHIAYIVVTLSDLTVMSRAE